MKIDPLVLEAVSKEDGWEIVQDGKDFKIKVYQNLYKCVHPLSIHLKIYRDETNPEIKYRHLKRAHDLLWPHMVPTWNYWDERRFRAHCEPWKYISYAGGASTGKSDCAARLADLEFIGDPLNTVVIVTSTTLDSLNRRIYGYCIRYLNEAAIPIKYRAYRGNSPHVLYDPTEMQHGIFAVSVKSGDDERAISTWIGRKARKRFIVVVDEATDTPVSILSAFPNLEQAAPFYRCMVIGNSNSKYDLHGVLSTPINGWGSVDPNRDTQWETTQKGGLCLYFSALESPAIHETDPKKKAILSKVFITEDSLKEKKQKYGTDSDAYYRFVLGFWRVASGDNVVISKEFLNKFDVYKRAEWLGVEPLRVVAGLDPAFSTGGDKCILRLAHLGQDVNGNVLLDFKGQDLLFEIQISARSGDSAEIQIAKQVVDILGRYGCPLYCLAVDASGQGRALGGTLFLQARASRPPLKIFTVRQSAGGIEKSFDVIPKTKHELWFDFRRFVECNSVRGIDYVAAEQFCTRMIIQNVKTLKQEIESKHDYKKRMGAIMPSLAHSPDEADACTLALQSAIINYGFHPGQTRDIPRVAPAVVQEIAQWKANVKAVQEAHAKKDTGIPVADFKGELNFGSVKLF
jgi:hypothetical protein